MKLVNWTGRLLGRTLSLERREVGGQIGDHDLELAVAMSEVLKTVLA